MKRIRNFVLTTIAAGLTLSLGSGSNALHAQQYSADRPIGATAQQLPTYLQHAGIEQRLNQSLPLSASFTDESNVSAPLSRWIGQRPTRSEEHTSELQSHLNIVCRLLLVKKKTII